MSGAILYYTCNTHLPEIDDKCREQLLKAPFLPIIAVSLNEDIPFGDIRIPMVGQKSPIMMHKQILAGLEATDAKYVFLCESDVLYHPSHFNFAPPRDDTFYYNVNVWKQRWPDNYFIWTDDLQQVSGVCANRKLLLEFYKARLEQIATDGFNRHYEPGVHQTVGSGKVENRLSEFPNICIRHDSNLTKSKWSPDEFRNKIYSKGWKSADNVPGWDT